MIMKKHISRRAMLRGAGVSLALPFLDAMVPAFAATSKSPCRMFVNYVPNGIIMKDFTPPLGPLGTDLPRIVQPMAPFRDKILILSGLQQYWGFGHEDGSGDHARAAATYLTGVHVKKTSGADIQAGISVDQVAADHVGSETRLPSLELTCEDGRVVGVCDSGYSCVYSNNISWRSSTTPNTPEINPRAVFERLFGDDDGDAAARRRDRRYESSILDWVLDDSRSLERKLDTTDRRKLDEYMTAVRQIELRIQKAERDNKELTPTIERPDATPADLRDEIRLMYDLLLVAFQTDSTRVSTLMVGREGSLKTYREIDIADSHHPLTHHRGDAGMIEKVYRINRYHMELFSEFMAKLAKTPDGDGTLLDHTMILYGGGLADGNRHQHDELPVMLAGGACGSIRGGRHVQVKDHTPLNNLYVSMLSRMGVEIEKLGDSTGTVRELSELA
jgi:hypothetical protein